ncbi:photosynthetic reaction center cytochrome PufC [Aurantiacibacter spongiae]|uniref:Photosynthetic reaction center cytochrome c subunit n=1 Tax=Aurantiacibacter spongiae TaxID=2488860 RepID=A0A3N5CW59_9SPHN|nr:photosynthetic reaction center cytochrome PufC [Aurantiacibacter spongiae]RPF71760.1 photosynthetic reaction center cytochrome c subunit [Aurantiacibacter spongiae]
MMRYGSVLFALALAVLAFAVLVPPWTVPTNVATTQTGPDSSAMGLYLDETAENNPPRQPEILPASMTSGGGAASGYSNLHVLGGLSRDEFDRTMVALTAWVAPEEGCGYCHGGQTENYAADYPRKEVARQMLQMTRAVNSGWTNHVGSRGVTCFTCHQDENVPEYLWHRQPEPEPPLGGLAGKPAPWDTRARTIRGFFPEGPYEKYLLEGQPARYVQANTALVSGDEPVQHNLEDGEDVYIMMMQMSQALGVNCTFCHQSRYAADWSQSPPNRLMGYSGIKMTLALNQQVFDRLTPLVSSDLLGPLGDAAKINCGSCHNGRREPAGGMNDVYYPALVGDGVPAPANSVARYNPHIPILARHPRVGPRQVARD